MKTSEGGRKNIFVIGLDDFNLGQLQLLEDAGRYRYRELISYAELRDFRHRSFEMLLKKARASLDTFDGSIDAIIAYWDFPATSLQAILSTDCGRPGPSLESTLKCEHKYWSRLEQQKATDALPEFRLVNPFAAPPLAQLDLDLPFWIKPVKAANSRLGFKIESEQDYAEALARIRAGIASFANGFNEILSHCDLPSEIAGVDGYHCLAESIVSGSQHTVCGYEAGGEIRVYGIVDSLTYPDSSSFFRFEYPSSLDDAICDRMIAVSRSIVRQIGLTNNPFNIEFFYNATEDRIKILEINPRVSQSHSDVFRKVDGESDEGLLIRLALGEDPAFPHREGDYAYAAKFYWRRFEDGRVRRLPAREEIDRLHSEHPGILLHIMQDEGQKVSEGRDKDSYSYVLATAFIGADTRETLFAKYRDMTETLTFEIDPE